MNPILINLGFIQIRWYSVLILFAFIIGYSIVLKQAKRKKISISYINDMCFYLVIFCILGARIYYCLFEFDYYKNNLLDIFKVWEGGLAIHGGIIAGILYVYFSSKKRNISMIKILDIFAPALALGQAIGRWGNFFNSEAYGPIVSLNKLQSLPIPNFVIKGMYINNNYHHPTFFYESIGCLIIFIILMIIRNRKSTKDGQVISIYFILYGIIRFLIESLRQDSLMLFDLKVAQLVSILMFLIGIVILIISFRRCNNDK